MKNKQLTILIFASMLILCLLLSGCNLHNDKLDAETQKLITALNQRDTDTIRQMLPEDGVDEEDFLSNIEQIYQVWQPCDPSEAKLTSLNYSKTTNQTIIEGVYSVPDNEQYNSIELQYVEPKSGSGYLSNFRLFLS